MLYRENGQFKTSYRADQQIFPILQDRWPVLLLLAFAFVLVPVLASDYLFRAILIPFLIMALAALGVNILVGYCGQISLGSGAFMAVGAYGAYNFFVRIPGMPLIPALILGGLCATAVRHPVRAAQPARAAACTWRWRRWRRSSSPTGCSCASSGSPWTRLRARCRCPTCRCSACPSKARVSKYLFCLAVLAVVALVAKNLVRSAIGREWMAIRDMDVAAAVIGIRPMYAKLSAFAVSSFIIGVAGALWAFVYLGAWEPAAFSVDMSFRLLFMVIIGGLGSIMGGFFGAAFIVVLPIFLNQFLPWFAGALRHDHLHRRRLARRADDLRRADRLVPDRRAARPGQAVVHRQAEAAPVALPALTSFTQPSAVPFHKETSMKLRNLAPGRRRLAAAAGGRPRPAPSRRPRSSSFRCCPTAPARTRPTARPGPTATSTTSSWSTPRGGINGVKLTFEECETGYDTARSVECYERLKSKGASFVQPLSTGATFAITEKAPPTRSRS